MKQILSRAGGSVVRPGFVQCSGVPQAGRGEGPGPGPVQEAQGQDWRQGYLQHWPMEGLTMAALKPRSPLAGAPALQPRPGCEPGPEPRWVSWACGAASRRQRARSRLVRVGPRPWQPPARWAVCSQIISSYPKLPPLHYKRIIDSNMDTLSLQLS